MSSKDLILVLQFAIYLSIFFACQPQEQVTNNMSEEFAQYLDDYYEEQLKLNPINATFAGDNRYNDQLPNALSDEFRATERSLYSKYKDGLKNFDYESLGANDRMSYDILKWECELALDAQNYKSDLTPIDQFWTQQLMVGQLASGSGAQPFDSIHDYSNWLSRLDDYLEWLDSSKSKMRQGIEQGYVLPKALAAKVIPQMEALDHGPVENHLFYGPINNMPEHISAEDQERIKQQYVSTISDKIIPAYKSMSDFFKNEYLPNCRESSGVYALSDGKERYDHLIKLFTTTTMTAEEIHQIGLKEVARLRSEMEKVMQDVGFEGRLNEFFDHVRGLDKLQPFTEAEEVIDNFNRIHDEMKPHLKNLFDLTPKAPFEVRRTEAFREASASAEYNPGSIDGTRPGIFYVPIPNVKEYNVLSDEDLFLHEAIPGHHYQISLQQENQDLPQFRKTLWYSAYGEGWALYSESLGKELGLYKDPYQYFGMLAAEMHRAIRLVVDTGIHAKGWTREEAIQYSLDNEAESEASIISEIERYMAMPGQALSYKIGQLKIMELRRKAEEKMGDDFDIKEFHNLVLEPGCVPLKILEDKVNAWMGQEGHMPK